MSVDVVHVGVVVLADTLKKELKKKEKDNLVRTNVWVNPWIERHDEYDALSIC